MPGIRKREAYTVFSLPITTSSTSTVVQYEGKITIAGRSDMSGLCYHAPSNIVYTLFDSSEEIVLLDPEGNILDEWNAPGDAQEGLAIRDCTLTIRRRTAAKYGFIPGCWKRAIARHLETVTAIVTWIWRIFAVFQTVLHWKP